jgi:amidase
MTTFPEYSQYDGLGLAELVRKKKVSPAELVEAAIERIEAHNPALNAVVTKMYDAARQAAKQPLPDGPFRGVPIVMKDLVASVEGVPTSAGNRIWKGIPAKQDSELVRRWKAAGVVVVGKSNTPEFGLTPYTESGALGAARNPWDTSRTPGGSSGGSGAAVAARMVPIGTGSDGGGSIRIPSSACGVFGLKPTRGRTPTGPALSEIWAGFGVEHVLTRSVRDSAAMLDATHGPDAGAPYYAPPVAGSFLDALKKSPRKLRIAFSGKPMLGKNVSPEVLEGLQATVRLLQELGHQLVEDAPAVDGEEFAAAYLTILSAEIRADIEETARVARKKVDVDDFDPNTFGAGFVGKALSAANYAAAARYLLASSRAIQGFFESCDVLLTPTLSSPPVRIGELLPSKRDIGMIRLFGRLDAPWLVDAVSWIKPLAAQTFEFLPWTPVFNVTGQPAMSVPLHWTKSGLPVGMHFVGKFGDEAMLFRLAGQLEEARPWVDKVPPLVQ